MSETDDTDVLLLIPPDFFLVRSSESEESLLDSSRTVVQKPKSCTAQVIGKLASQVHSLESRLETLEINTTINDSSFGTIPRRKNWESDSLDSHSKKSFTFPHRRRRKLIKKKQDSSLVSLVDSVSSKSAVSPLHLRESEFESFISNPKIESPSMDGDISSIVSTPSKKDDKLLLREIDEYLAKVEYHTIPEARYKCSELSEASLRPENVIKATGDYLAQKLDSNNSCDEVKLPSGRTVPYSVLEKYIYLVRNRSGNSTNRDALVAPSCSQKGLLESQRSESLETPKATEPSKDVLERKSPGVRKLNFVDKQSISVVQPTSTPKKPQQSLRYLDTFNPSSNKIYDRATKVLEEYKSHNFSHENVNRNRETTAQNSYDTEYRDCGSISQHRNQGDYNHSSERHNRNAENPNRGTNYRSEPNYLLKEEFKLPQMRPYVHDDKELRNKIMETVDTELLSLSELWGDRGEKGDRDRGESNKLEEERLKREHCEAMIQDLQKKVLQQQEKLAVAVRVDHAKDAALGRLKEAGQQIAANLERAESRHRAALDSMLREVDGFKRQMEDAHKKTNHFEKELYKALDLAHDYQEKCKQLSEHMQQIKDSAAKEVAATQETLASRDREIQVLRDNCETVMRLNKQHTDCSKNLEEVLAKERTEHEQTKSQILELHSKLQSLNEEMALVKQERDLLRTKLNEERARCSLVERQLCDQHNETGELVKRCEVLGQEVKSLQSQLEQQRTEMRTLYQSQLENAVLAKLREFESQLESAQAEIENEAKEKEAALCDTFQKQVASIEDQHKLEVSVLEEKHREEIKLYRLQLAQAGERAGLLENKLDTYRRRRTQIASQLHSVMETQWRQALAILTNGQGGDGFRPRSASSAVECGSVAPLSRGANGTDREGWLPQRERDGDSGMSLSDHDLKQYVKMLLAKPPNLDGSGDASHPEPGKHLGFDARRDEEPTSDRADKRSSKEHKRSVGAKPPWKA